MSVEAATAASLTGKGTTKVHPFKNTTETQSNHTFWAVLSALKLVKQEPWEVKEY